VGPNTGGFAAGYYSSPFQGEEWKCQMRKNVSNGKG
jgi:hypothetical protein